MPSRAYPIRLRPRRTVSLRGCGVRALPRVAMVALPRNQDACKGARLTLKLGGKRPPVERRERDGEAPCAALALAALVVALGAAPAPAYWAAGGCGHRPGDAPRRWAAARSRPGR